MNTISKTAARTLEQLVNMAKASGRNYVKVDANGPESGIMPVTVELVNSYPAAHGLDGLELWSVAHYYTQNGDAMRDPEIVYAVPVYQGRRVFEFAYPQEWTQDGLAGLGRMGAAMSYQRLVELDRSGKPVRWMPKVQRNAATFTTTWMRNIKAQQLDRLNLAA
ncbi:MAG: hypothetical protein QY325_04315 [Flavobacteriales bacterium]|nr:MAG: hypothetical protein QY325_04315 [Flavobacteriales bacterium]